MTGREPQTSAQDGTADRTRRPYRVVAVSLYQAEVNEADRCTDALKRAGWPKANRSLVIREAVMLLQEALAGKDDERVFRYFVERHARRAGGGVPGSRRPELQQPHSEEAPTSGPVSPGMASETPDHSRRLP